MKNLLFIRHGESEANSQGICAGKTDVQLTKLGIAQAKEAGRELKESGRTIDLIISSPLKRARDTAKEIADQLGYPQDKIIFNDDATERYRGEFEGKPTALLHGVSDDMLIAKGAESEASMLERAKNLIDFAKSRPEPTILIVSHNQFGRSLIALAHKRERENVSKLPNAKVIKII